MTLPPANEETTAPAPETAEAPKPAKATRKPLPAWMTFAGIILFVVVALTVGYLIWLLANTFQLGKLDNSYTNGRVVEKNVFQDVQGWGSELVIDKKPEMPARIRFLLRDKMRKPITDAEVTIFMAQADSTGVAPTKADLKMVEPGVYRGEVNIPVGGLWEARIQVKEHGNAYQITQRVNVPMSAKEKADQEKADKDAKAAGDK